MLKHIYKQYQLNDSFKKKHILEARAELGKYLVNFFEDMRT